MCHDIHYTKILQQKRVNIILMQTKHDYILITAEPGEDTPGFTVLTILIFPNGQ